MARAGLGAADAAHDGHHRHAVRQQRDVVLARHGAARRAAGVRVGGGVGGATRDDAVEAPVEEGRLGAEDDHAAAAVALPAVEVAKGALEDAAVLEHDVPALGEDHGGLEVGGELRQPAAAVQAHMHVAGGGADDLVGGAARGELRGGGPRERAVREVADGARQAAGRRHGDGGHLQHAGQPPTPRRVGDPPGHPPAPSRVRRAVDRRAALDRQPRPAAGEPAVLPAPHAALRHAAGARRTHPLGAAPNLPHDRHLGAGPRGLRPVIVGHVVGLVGPREPTRCDR